MNVFQSNVSLNVIGKFNVSVLASILTFQRSSNFVLTIKAPKCALTPE